MKKYRICVAGGRDITDYSLVKEELDEALTDLPLEDVEIVCGMCEGVDMLGYRYAVERGIAIKEMPADWKTFKRSAGPIRNLAMVRYSNRLFVFWNGKSKGSKDILKAAKRCGLDYVSEILVK